MRCGFMLAFWVVGAWAQTFELPPLSTTVDVKGQPLAVTVTAAIAQRPSGMAATLDVGLADLQRNILPILAAQLNQSNRCGERIEMHSANLQPAAPSALLEANLHFENWACAKAFGREIVKRLVGGDATVRVRLTPRIDNAALGMDSEVTSVDADGSLGELLHSGKLGEALQQKMRDSIASALQKAMNPRTVLPPALQEIVTPRAAQFNEGPKFNEGPRGPLLLHVSGDVRISPDQAAALLEKLKGGR